MPVCINKVRHRLSRAGNRQLNTAPPGIALPKRASLLKLALSRCSFEHVVSALDVNRLAHIGASLRRDLV